VHLFTAFVMAVVLVFVVGFGHRLNDVLTQSLAMRYENVDLIAELRQRSRAAQEARGAAEAANRAKSQLLAAASHDLRQPLHALGLYVAALAARAKDTEWRGLVGSVQQAAEVARRCARRGSVLCADAEPLIPQMLGVPGRVATARARSHCA